MAISEQRRERMAEALKLRKRGKSFQAISDELGIGRTQAFKDVTEALKEITREPAEELLALELERLDELWAGLYDLAREGDEKAATLALKVMHQRARYLALYPKDAQTDVTVSDVKAWLNDKLGTDDE